MQWIGSGSIKIGGKYYKYGEKLPVDQLPSKTLEREQKAGNIGVIPEKYDPSKHLDAKLEALGAANKELKAEVEKLTEENEELKAEVKKLKKFLKKAKDVEK